MANTYSDGNSIFVRSSAVPFFHALIFLYDAGNGEIAKNMSLGDKQKLNSLKNDFYTSVHSVSNNNPNYSKSASFQKERMQSLHSICMNRINDECKGIIMKTTKIQIVHQKMNNNKIVDNVIFSNIA